MSIRFPATKLLKTLPRYKMGKKMPGIRAVDHVYKVSNNEITDDFAQIWNEKKYLVYEWLIMSIKGANHAITDDFAQIWKHLIKILEKSVPHYSIIIWIVIGCWLTGKRLGSQNLEFVFQTPVSCLRERAVYLLCEITILSTLQIFFLKNYYAMSLH